MTDRLETMRAMVARSPNNPLARFGLANELLKAGLHEEAAEQLSLYLAQHDDEGAGWLRLVDTLRTLGRDDEARAAIAKGMEAAERHRHATLTAEFEERLESFD